MLLFCCVHALEQSISTLFFLIKQLFHSMTSAINFVKRWLRIDLQLNTTIHTIELWMEKKNVRIEPFLCTFKIPQYNQWPISEYTIARPKEKKFINKPGWKGYKKEIMLIQALIWKWIDLNLWSNWQNYTVQWCPTAK